MNKKTLQKIINMKHNDKAKDTLYQHGLDIRYYSDSLLDYTKEYLEIILEDFDEITMLKQCLTDKLNYEINKYKNKKNEVTTLYKNPNIEKDYDVNRVFRNLEQLERYNIHKQYTQGYYYGKYEVDKWLLKLLTTIENRKKYRLTK